MPQKNIYCYIFSF